MIRVHCYFAHPAVTVSPKVSPYP